VNNGTWLAGAALAAIRLIYPAVLEQRHARRLPVGRDGIILGAEPVDLPRPGAPAVLVLHGGGDTPQSMRALSEFLFAHGYAVRAPLLADHGRSLQNFRRFDAERWRDQIRAEVADLREHHPWVSIVGQSVGGALALDVAAESAEVRALVLLAPWVAMPAGLRWLAQTSFVWGPLVPYLPSLGGHSIHDQVAKSKALTQGLVTPALLRALSVLARVANEALPRVRVPTLTMQSREDTRIASAAAQDAFDRLGAAEKKFEWLSDTGHVISVDFGRERVFKLTAEWLDSHRG
jgi:carboxylesterase